MPPPSWRRSKRRNTTGLGRNCAIFETARTWAYRDVRRCPDRSPAASAWLATAISSHVEELNTAFPEPLPASETRAIATSIHRWITTRSRMWADGAVVYEATLVAIQSARGRKGGRASGETRRQRSLELGRSLL
jgi:hypothetical protein